MTALSSSPDSSAALPPEALSTFGVERYLKKHETCRDGADEVERWFHQEVLPHEPWLRAWLRRSQPALQGQVDDIVQESYLRLMQARAGGRVRSARYYLFGIARNIAVNLVRAGQRFATVPVNELPEADVVSATEDVVAAITYRQELQVTEEVIAELPERCREIVRLHSLEGLAYRDIAARLELSEATIRVHMMRAIRLCATKLKAQGVERP